jgi:hypothetical protein
MRFISIIIIVVFMIACKKETPNYNIRDNANSKQEQDILYEELHGINIGPINKYGLIADIHFMNDKLLMLDVKSDSIFVHYNLKGELKKSFNKGEGPNEFVSPQFLKITGFNNFSTDIQIFDFNKGLFKLNLIDQKKESYFTLGNYDYKTSVQSIVLIEEGIFAMANLDPLIKFSIYNDVVKKTKKIPHNKNFDIVNYKRYLESVTPVDIGFNKKHKLIYTWNGALNSIDLHDKNGVFIKSYSFGTNKNINNKNFDRKYFYYYNVKSQGDYIYGIYAGFNTFDNFTESLIPNLKSEIHVFNIKTDEMKRYKLDRLVNSCSIDFENNIVYCIDENSESQPLMKYEINKKN